MKLFYILSASTAFVAAFSTLAFAGDSTTPQQADPIMSSAPTTAEQHDVVAKLKEVSAEELKQLMDTDDSLVIIDSRKPSEYAAGHIRTAIELRADEATNERLAALIPSKDATVVFYCGNRQCPASGKTAYKAAQAGYTNILKYAEGIDDWRAKGLPVVAE